MPREGDMNIERENPRSGPSEFREQPINRELLPGVKEAGKAGGKAKWESTLEEANKPENAGGRNVLLRLAKEQAEVALRKKGLGVERMTQIAKEIGDIERQIVVPQVSGGVIPIVSGATPEVKSLEENKITLTELTGLSNTRFISRVREMYRTHIATTEDKKLLTDVDLVEDWILNKKITRTSLTEAVDIFLDGKGEKRKIRLKDPETGEDKVYEVKEIVEGEIGARCNLRLAQIKEEALKRGEFGKVTTQYVEDLAGGAFAEAEVSNKTLIWLGEILPQLDRGEALRTLTDIAFQQVHRVAQVIEQFRPRHPEEKSKWDFFEKMWQEVRIDGKIEKQEKFKTEGKKKCILSSKGEEEIKKQMKVYGIDEGCLGLIKDSIESKLSIFSGKGNDIYVEKLRGILEAKYGTDAATLAWQMFEGLRCEAQYFSGHYLGVLNLLNESRNFLATGPYDSWKGSKHGKIAVRRDGKWRNSEDEELSEEDRKQLDWTKMCGPKDTYKNKDGKDEKGKAEDGDVLYFGNAFVAEGELERAATTPLTQNIKISDDVKGAVLMDWAEKGMFLQKFKDARKVLGEVTIETTNAGVVRSGYALREAITALGGVYDQQDKASQIPEVIKTLTGVKKNALLQVGKLVFSSSEDADNLLVNDLMRAEIYNAYWELGIKNIFNTRGSQKVDKPFFLTPSGYNAFFERLVSIPSSGRPLIKQDDMKSYREKTEDERTQSFQRLKEMAITPEEKKIVTKEKAEVYEMTLPEKLGGKKESNREKAIRIGREIGENPVGATVKGVSSLVQRKRK